MTHHEIPYRNMNEYEFRSQEEILRQALLEKFLQAMREDLSEWLSSLSHNVSISADNFLNDLENGIILCQHARLIQRYAEEYAVINSNRNIKIPTRQVFYKERNAFPGSFVSRDNVANFIGWCRELGIPDVLMFESDDLIMQKNEKSVILTLMEVARKAYIFGVQPPEIVRFEKEIDAEIDKEKEAVMRGKPPQKPRDLEEDNNLDTMVRNIVNKCQCYDRFPIKKLAEGKYQVGRNAALIFVRVMRKHVMVRVGGGWDTFDHYITKHDPCRTKVMGTIESDGHTKTQLPTDNKLNAKILNRVEHTVATSTDTSSMCSSSSDGSEGVGQDTRMRCSHRNSMTASDTEVNNENTDPAANFTRSIEEIDKKLKQLENRKPSLDISMKDPMVYDNKSDRWLRSHLNTIKQNSQTPNDSPHTCTPPQQQNPQANFTMQRGYTEGYLDRREERKVKEFDTTPKALRRKSNNNVASKGKQPIQRQLSYTELRQSKNNSDSSTSTTKSSSSTSNRKYTSNNNDRVDGGKQNVVSPVSSLDSNSIKSEPIRRSCNDMSTQTEFNDDEAIKSSKIPRSMLRGDSSRIPRPVMMRSKTADAIPLRKKKLYPTPNCYDNNNNNNNNNSMNNNNNSNNNSMNNHPSNSSSNRTRNGPTERPIMRREKSDIPPSMRREKSNLTSRSKRPAVPRGSTATTVTPRKDKSRSDAPVKIRNGPELRV